MTIHETTTESGIVIDRRQLIAGASAVGLGAAFASAPAMAQGTPKKGGVLRLGMEGDDDRQPSQNQGQIEFRIKSHSTVSFVGLAAFAEK